MGRRGEFGSEWWARRWLETLESLGWAERLQRGRSYARAGRVLEIEVTPGQVTARVQGSRPRPYTVRIQVRPLSDEQWKRVLDALAERASFAARLLAGEMPVDIEEAFQAAHCNLFPASSRQISTSCSCPDWANPCKHIAAVYYLLGREFDDDPFLMFVLRGRTREQVLAALRERRTRQARALAGGPTGGSTAGAVKPAVGSSPTAHVEESVGAGGPTADVEESAHGSGPTADVEESRGAGGPTVDPESAGGSRPAEGAADPAAALHAGEGAAVAAGADVARFFYSGQDVEGCPINPRPPEVPGAVLRLLGRLDVAGGRRVRLPSGPPAPPAPPAPHPDAAAWPPTRWDPVARDVAARYPAAWDPAAWDPVARDPVLGWLARCYGAVGSRALGEISRAQ